MGIEENLIRRFVGTSLGRVEELLIKATLDDKGGDKAEAAKVLGISLRTLYNKLAQYETTTT